MFAYGPSGDDECLNLKFYSRIDTFVGDALSPALLFVCFLPTLPTPKFSLSFSPSMSVPFSLPQRNGQVFVAGIVRIRRPGFKSRFRSAVSVFKRPTLVIVLVSKVFHSLSH